MKRLFLIILTFILFSANSCSSEMVPTLDDNTIVFVAKDESTDIYSISSNGDNLTRLTNMTIAELQPNISPDRHHILFRLASEGDSKPNGQIYVMNPDGSDVRRLTEGIEMIYHPVWSPDGKMIAFQGYKNSQSSVWVVNQDASDLRKLVSDNDSRYPAWSPDSSRIAYVSYTVKNGEIDNIHLAVSTVNGTDTRMLSLPGIWPSYPAWSPDGKQILFTNYNSNSNWYRDGDPLYSLYIVDTDGENLRKISGLSYGHFAVWCPDGTKIAYLADKSTIGFDPNQHNIYDLCVMDSDGENKQVIGVSYSESLSWSPDSQSITFVGGPNDVRRLYSIRWDGTGLTELTGWSEFKSIRDVCWSSYYYPW